MNLGLVLTPENTANYIISKLGKIRKGEKVLDPCVGPGVFIKILLKKGIKPQQISSYDIDDSFRKDIEALGVRFTTKDTLLEISEKDYNKFDYIIGNPPYLNKSSEYIKKNKKNLKKIYGHINSHESYAMFMINSIWRLKEGGKLVLITSDSYLTLRTHTKLRRFILESCKIKEILLAPQTLFQDQEVSTSTCIITLEKFKNAEKKKIRQENTIKIIPRIEEEFEYENPSKINYIQQKKYEKLPFNIFAVDIEDEIIDLFEQAPKLKTYLKGYIGMHTHDNRRFIAAIEGTELSKIFKKRNKNIDNEKKKYKIITKEELNSEKWRSYLKRGGKDQYYRPIMEALRWDEESIQIYDIPINAPFEKEGIVISGVSSRLAARYMPPGCYWDSNKAIGFIIINNLISINYALGLLNSSLYNYLAKGIINNTNSIQLTGLHSLPIIIPNNATKKKVENLVRHILQQKKSNLKYDYSTEQRKIDQLIFETYSDKFDFPSSLKSKLDTKFSCYIES